jgi:glycosyltransferase involved in cell wall biosynthesis
LKEVAGGIAQAVAMICRGLTSAGVDVTIIAQSYKVPVHRGLIDDGEGVKVEEVFGIYLKKWNFPISLDFKRRLKDICCSNQFELIHDHGLWLPHNGSVADLSKRFGIPLLISPHGMLEPGALALKALPKRFIWYCFQRSWLQQADVLFAASNQEYRHFRQMGLKQPVAIIPHGVQIPEFPERAPKNSGVRTVLFLSRFHPIKGLVNLISAWKKARPKGWRLILAGPDEGNYQKVIMGKVEAEGLQGEIQFIGPVYGHQKEQLYCQADIFVLPSFSENFGMVVAEALAYGLPVIASKGTPWETLEMHQCGWWVNNTVDELAKALEEAVNLSDHQRIEMGIRGRQLVESHYSWDRVTSQMIEVYLWVLQGRKQTPAYLIQ